MPIPPSERRLDIFNEAAKRLRSVGLYDNELADRFVSTSQKLEKLEEFKKRFEQAFPPKPPKLSTWQECKEQIVRIAQYVRCSFTEIPSTIETCLTAACVLSKLERDKEEVPHTIRLLQKGEGLVIEFEKREQIIVSYGEPH